MPEAPYRRVQVIVNPASGRDEPILNVLNDVFRQHEVDWDVSVTHRYGDAARPGPQGRRGRRRPRRRLRRRRHAARDRQRARGGGGRDRAHDADGHPARRHGQRVRPGDGRARHPAGGHRGPVHQQATRAVDVGRLRDLGQATIADRYFVQRLYVGVEPEEQTSRELKDKYGVFAYLVNAARHARDTTPSHYRAELDGESIEFDATKVYVVNSGMMGTGLRITHSYAVDDGLLDCFLIDQRDYATLAAAAIRFLDLPMANADDATIGSAARSGSRPSPTSPCGRTASTSGARP